MTQKAWFITGASRGLGVQIAKAAMDAGDRVVATGRKCDEVVNALGADSERLLTIALDVTDLAQARMAVQAAVDRFGGIDVLVNNAGYGHLGTFEEVTPQDAQKQFATNIFGAFNVCWAALPLMRAARSGRIFNVSSIAGFVGSESGALYYASKFALEGFSESLAKEVTPFGIFVTIVEPGYFRIDFLSGDSLQFAKGTIDDYAQLSQQLRDGLSQKDGRQAGDPAKLGRVFVQLANEAKPPLRFAAGSDAVKISSSKHQALMTELDRWRELSVSTDGNYPR
jgi:NAD(P)-dependent dehydrogenase (short-subunit alcohol dehydrogenase family)